MTKLVLLSLLLLSFVPVYAVNPQKPCRKPILSENGAEWIWMDRDCHTRTQAELDRILEKHNLWVRKYSLLFKPPLLGRPLPLEASRNRLRADLSGAHLDHADLTGAHLEAADLTGAHLEAADLTGTSLINAEMTGAYLERADLAGAHLEYADLTGASLRGAEMTGAQLPYADLTCAHLLYTDVYKEVLAGVDLTGARVSPLEFTCASLDHADLTRAQLNAADMVGANLFEADLTGAGLFDVDLTRAFVAQADLTGAGLFGANLTGTRLSWADLKGAYLTTADLTGASFLSTDLSSTTLQGTDFSDANLTLAKLWYADFEPKVLPPLSTLARTEGLQTLRWSESFNEIGYRRQLEEAGNPNSQVGAPPPPSSLPDRWILWLSRYREISMGQTNGWRNNLEFLWNDAFYGLQPHRSKQRPPKETHPEAKLNKNLLVTKSQNEGPIRHTTEEQNQYSLIDVRNALNRAGYSKAELQVNLAYQRHTQSALGMILYDWTCEYGAAPLRPLIIALALALLATPLYWLAIRQSWFGSQLLIVEKRGQEEIETSLGNPLARPSWRAQLPADPPSSQARPEKLPERLHLWLASNWLRLRQLIVCVWPRLRWEAGFTKAVVLFSLIGIVNLGFEGLDFGRWIRNLTFREYDLKARGWLRTASGLQSLVGLALLALSLLSFFGHRFE